MMIATTKSWWMLDLVHVMPFRLIFFHLRNVKIASKLQDMKT